MCLVLLLYPIRDDEDLPVGETRDTIHSIGAIRSVNIRCQLLFNRWVHSVVDQVQVKMGGVSAGFVVSMFSSSTADYWGLGILDGRPFHLE